mgnify:CR=1 FL=1
MTKKNHDADVAFIQALAELLRENDLTELQVKRDYSADDSLNVRVSRHQPQRCHARSGSLFRSRPQQGRRSSRASWSSDIAYGWNGLYAG